MPVPCQVSRPPRTFRRAARLGGLGLLVVLVLGVAGLAARDGLVALWHPLAQMMGPKRSVEEVMREIAPQALDRLAPYLAEAGFVESWPRRLRLVALKEERLLEVWGADEAGDWRPIRRYPVLAASGGPGPKLAEGDRQVPEGHYPITLLNPNSAYHLSLRIGYPSAEDRTQAALDGRRDLGGDIMVHGRDRSIGCLAIGDQAIEEVFALTAKVGVNRTDILIVPFDLRRLAASDLRDWVQARYDRLREALLELSDADWDAQEEAAR